MKKQLIRTLFVGIPVIIVVTGAAFWYSMQPEPSTEPPIYTGDQGTSTIDIEKELVTQESPDAPRVEVIAENLTIPWEILFLPDGEMLVTERPGRLVFLKRGETIDVSGIRHTGEGGLLGAALHPAFDENNYIYLYQTTEGEDGLTNRIIRYTLTEGELVLDRVILDNLPGAMYHDGGRMVFGPDGYLYVTVGDATDAREAQDPQSLEGTLLRMTDEGDPAPGNPFDSLVYSYGHRNAQGITWDDDGRLWSSEHGRSGVRSGYDEINLIVPGGNYGWPDSQGNDVAEGTIAPVRHSSAEVTWAPGDLAYYDGSLYMPGLRGRTLYEAVLEGETIVEWKEHFVGEYGRLRTVRVGPDGLLYILTSNRDGRGDPAAQDDRIIRINPHLLD